MAKDPKPKIVELTQSELDALLQRLKDSALPPSDKTLFAEVIANQRWLYHLFQLGRLTTRKLCSILFGNRNEKRSQKKKKAPKDDDSKSDPEGDSVPADGASETPSASAKRPGHGRLGAEDYKTREQAPVSHPDLKVGDPCPEPPCSGHLYAITPGSFIHIKGQSMSSVTEYVIEKLRCSACGLVVSAPLPEDVTTKYDSSFITILALQRFFLGVPWYRQAHFQKMLGSPLPESTQWELIERLAGVVIPVMNRLEYLAAQGDLMHNDDTSVRILSLIRENQANPDLERTGMYTTGLLGFAGKHRIVLFYSGRRHAGENLDRILRHRDPDLPAIKLMCDALSMNVPKNHKVLKCNCLSHARRKFVEVEYLFEHECGFVLDALGKVYHRDDIAKEEAMSDDERLAYHQEHSESVMEELHAYLSDQIEQKRVEPNSVLGKAIQYSLKNWIGLTRFLSVAGVPLDNNRLEQKLKGPIRGRKNSLFHGTEYSAQMSSYIISLIYSCHENGINPHPYFNALQAHKEEVAANPDEWLPWNYEDALQPALYLAA